MRLCSATLLVLLLCVVTATTTLAQNTADGVPASDPTAIEGVPDPSMPLPSLSPEDAQAAVQALSFLISAPGECLFQTSDIPAGAPSSNMAALWLRSVFHDAGTFSSSNSTGGLDASLALQFELDQIVNGGIAPALATRFIPHSNPISKADMIALGGIVTVATCGGPQVPFVSGRQDAVVPNDLTMLPADAFGTVDTIAAGFERMGLSRLDMLVLVTGSHSLGGAHHAISPNITNATFAPFDSTPGIFDNDIFNRVLAGNCVIPIDCAFSKDPTLLPYINLFASSQNAFFTQYAISFEKMLNLSPMNLSDPIAIVISKHQDLMNQGAWNGSLTLNQAQQATGALTFLINGPGECLHQTTDLQPSAPSKNMAALWLRTIFHDAGTFDAADGSGGLDASITTLNETSDMDINGGIGPSLSTRFIPTNNPITQADMIALGGIVTVATCGGPQVPFRTGRKSTNVPNNFAKMLPHDPHSPVSVIQAGFERMGLSALDMVTLTVGSHSMGGAHKAITPSITNETFTPFDTTPGVFDNDIFKQVLAGKCVVPLDCLFPKVPELREVIINFANNQTAFFEQYAISLDKMMNLTTSTLSDPLSIMIKQHADLIAQGSVGNETTGEGSGGGVADVTGSASASSSRVARSVGYGAMGAFLVLLCNL
ncbi:L-ascorbate peroxidase 3 [Podochytrium sp. JEL0797]|nr:L-ascorbate peroxidase 3 [Podochytrium sp. JEL0797]